MKDERNVDGRGSRRLSPHQVVIRLGRLISIKVVEPRERHHAVVLPKLFLLVISAAALSPIAAAETKTLSIHELKGQQQLEIRYGDDQLLLYSFAKDQFKPYVKELRGLNRQNILRDAPPDHLHHHGLMFAIRVNGTNFWEETGEPGIQRHEQLLDLRSGRDANGKPQASFSEIIHWICFRDKARTDTADVALLMERRTLTLAIDPASQELMLRWASRFMVGPAIPKVVLTGSAYNGLGLRLPIEFDKTALFKNSENGVGPLGTKWDVAPARWTSFAGKIDGKPTTVVLFGERKPQAWGVQQFFSMREPFAYISVTKGLDVKPVEFKTGDRFAFEYSLAIYPEIKTAEFIEKRFQTPERLRTK